MTLRPPLFVLALVAGCAKEPVVEVIPGVTADVEVVLANPTDCPVCDPFADIDTLRLEVSVDGDVVASDNFAWPGEAVTLPDLTGFGVVRITLLGLADGRVLSAGRTAEVVLVPDRALSVPLVFLPANRALPLAAPMVAERYRPVAIPRRDGSVLFAGGFDPRRERVSAVAEAYDPATGAFVELEPLPLGVAAPTAVPVPDGRLLVGGLAMVNGNPVPVEDAVAFDEVAATFATAGEMSAGRSGHCVAMFRERQGLVLGGAEGAAEYMKPDDSGVWTFSTLDVRELDEGAVTACTAAGEDLVFVQGRDAASTGVWSESASEELSEGFRAVAGGAGEGRYVDGAALLALGDGTVRVLGGADASTGEVYADGRLFSTETRRFEAIAAFRAPRFDPRLAGWIEPGWYVAGCGWADAERTTDEPTLELFAPLEEVSAPLVELDRDRQGCALAVLPDGSVLVAGGGAAGPVSGADAALVVPWIDLAEAG